MIEELRIRGLGVIDEAAVDLGPGLTCVTGETGAGKTMVVTSLALLLGGRADAGAVRTGSAQAEVEGRVATVDPEVWARVEDAGGATDDGALVLARTVGSAGRSRAVLGGRTVPAAVLAEVGASLVTVHGQNDQQRLLRPAQQRHALDRYAGAPVADLLEAYRTAYERLRVVEAEEAEIAAHLRERAQEADLLRFGLGEIETVSPQPGEDEALAVEAARLGHAESLREAATGAHALLRSDADALGSDSDALTSLARAVDLLERVRDHDPDLAGPLARLRDASALAEDVAAELATYAASVDADPARLAEVQQRLADLGGLRRKYGDTVAEVLAWAERARDRLGAVGGDDERLSALQAESVALRATLAARATELSAARAAAGERFAAEVSAELAALAMPQARLEVALRHAAGGPDGLVLPGEADPVAFGPHGVDEVELLLVPHPGAPARPLARGASGGELSRVMLAVEVVLGATDPVPTFVFDEVDAGVGGRAAVEVGRRLARLSRSAQVLVVTHLPQVAAFADRHLVVRKDDAGAVTAASVVAVDGEDRVRELSRMLAGQEDSETAAAHAAELLDLAAVERPDAPVTAGARRRKGRR
ncbi:MAG: DNA repair protein RecN [Candidatus Nanopelagicales bacterium]